ncbi:hypothetical protein [Stenotrophomonas sp. 24(2023)]|uniref:hypothetical protein n=1 Tax=Stenotrophomonas sp. 24(2023) TaxID=3068324 RepID=UPI0027E11492|nr:hypothetical protein [Stenotrophomonas sp. 24(2023)]WMJ69741.1 hypothetical protein Q9R17_01115 [Stenotrophomonas sp. 24(2023)]
MNTAQSPVSPLGTLRWLLKREYWESRGGFLYAPVIAGAVSLVMSTLGVVLGLFALRRAATDGNLVVNNSDINVNGLDLALLTRQLNAKDMADLGNGLDLTLVLSSTWPFVVLAFVVFFYCLGALYDDRRDRSLLFWKSLPLSDTQTVLSKAISALLIAPAITVLAAIATMFGFLAVICVVVLVHGGDVGTLILGPANPLTLAAGLVTALPLFALWALPTVGWLLLCSAWAKSKPFLWAVMLPLFAGIIVSTTRVMQLFEMGSGWFWQHVVGRLLLGTFAGMDLLYRSGDLSQRRDLDSVVALMNPTEQLRSLAMPDLWIGAAVGVVFIVLAIRLRRRAGEV